MKSQSSKLIRLSILALAMLLSFGGSAWAASVTWTSATGGTWGTGSNWSTGSAPAGGDTAVFNSVVTSGTISAAVAAGNGSNILFAAGAGPFTIGSGAVNSQSYVMSTGNSFTMNSGVTSDQLFNIRWYFGGTTGASGTYSAINNSTTNKLTFAGSLTAQASGTKVAAFGGAGNIDVTGALTKGSATSLTVIKTGNGTLKFTGSNTYGDTTLTAGTVQIGVNSAGSVGSITSSAIGTGTVTFNGGTLSSDGTNARTILNAVTFTGNAGLGNATNTGKLTFSANANLGTSVRTITANSDAQFDGIISNTGGITKSGTGTLILTNNSNSFTGNITIGGTSGVLRVTGSGALGTGTKTVTNTAGSSGSPDGANLLELDSNGGPDFTLGSNISYNLSGAAGVIRNAAGNNTIAGNISMTTGNGMVKILSNGGSLTLSGTVTANTNRDFELAGTSTGANTFSGVLQNNGANIASLVKSGTGTWIVSGSSNTFTGNTKVNQGTLKLTNNLAIQNSAFDTSGAGTLDLTDAGINTLTIGGLTGSNILALPVNVTSLTLNPGSGATVTYAGNLTGGPVGLTLTKTGAGVQILSGSSNYDGLTTVGVGVLGVGHNNALGTTTGATTVSNGAQLQLQNGVTVTGETVTIGGTGPGTGNGAFNGGLSTAGGATAEWAGTVIFGDSSARIGSGTNGTLTVSGAVQGSGTNQTLNIGAGAGGSGTVILSATAGTNSYTGPTLIARGTLKLGATDTLPTGTILDVDYANAGENATFDINGFNQTIAGLQRSNTGGGAGGSFVTNSSTTSAVLTVNTGTAYTYSGQVTGNLGLTQSGTGSLTLTASNTYSGATTVNNGTLNVNGSLVSSGSTTVNGGTLNVNGSIDAASTVSVAGGATLRGSGVVSGTATILDGGLVTAGFNGAGNLTIGNLVFSGSGTVNVTGNGAVPGSVLNVTGALTTAGNIVITASNAFGWTNDTPYDLITWGSILGTGTSSFTPTSITVLNLNPRQSAAPPTFSGTSVILTISGYTPKWTGADNSDWVVGSTGTSSNWVLVGSGTANGTATDYISGDAVLFNDDAGNTTVNISAADVTPVNTTFNTTNGYTLQSSGGFGIAGSGVLNKGDGGTLTITSSNSYTGATTINAGILQIGDGTTDGSIASSASINNNGTLTYNLVGSQSYANAITGATGLLIKNGGGTLTLSGTNSYGGGTIINTGTLVAASANALGTGGVTNDATLDLTAGAVTYSGLSTSLSGTGTVNVTLGVGTGSTILNGNYSAFTGIWNVGVGAGAGAGKVQMNGADATGATVNLLPNATLYVTTGGTRNAALSLGGGDTGESLGQLRVDTVALNWAGPVTLAGTVTGTSDYTVGGSQTVTISGAINETGGAQSLIKGAANTLILGNSNSYSGGTTIVGGIVEASNNNALGSGTVSINTGATRLVVDDGITIANNIVINGGGASSRGLIENSGAGNATVSGTITINNGLFGGGYFASTGGGTLTVAGPIISATNQVLSRLGTVIYSGGGSYSNFSLLQGTAMLGANNGLSTSAAMDLGLSGAATFDLAGYNQSLVGITKNTNGATIASSGTASDSLLTLTGSSTYGGSITNVTGTGSRKTALAINSGGFLTYTGNYTGDTVTVNGTLALNSNGGDSFAPTSRSIIVNNGGLLRYDGSDKVQNDTVITVNVGGTLDMNGKSDAIGYLAGGGSVTNVNATLNIDMPLAGSGSNFSGTISGNSQLVFRGVGTGGPGTQILSGTGSYTGSTTISAGTLNLTGALLSTSSITVGASGFLTESSTGLISGTGSLTSSGTTVLNGSNNYTGSTTISAGKLTAGNVSALGAAGRTVNVNGGTLDLATDTSANAYSLNVSSGFTGTVLVNRATLGTGTTHTMGSSLLGNGTLNAQAGSNVTGGTATLAFASINLSAGTTGFGTTTLNPTSADILVSGSIFKTGGSANSLTLDGTSTGNVVAGPIAGALIVNKTNSSTWTLSGSSSYTNGTNLNAGTLVVNSADSLGASTGNLTFGGTGGTLKLAATIPSSARNYVLNSTGAIDTNGFDLTNSGVVSGTAGLAKNGAGSLNLNGTASYTGVTNVNNGTLNVNTALASTNLSVASGATMNLNVASTTGTASTGDHQRCDELRRPRRCHPQGGIAQYHDHRHGDAHSAQRWSGKCEGARHLVADDLRNDSVRWRWNQDRGHRYG